MAKLNCHLTLLNGDSADLKTRSDCSCQDKDSHRELWEHNLGNYGVIIMNFPFLSSESSSQPPHCLLRKILKLMIAALGHGFLVIDKQLWVHVLRFTVSSNQQRAQQCPLPTPTRTSSSSSSSTSSFKYCHFPLPKTRCQTHNTKPRAVN